MRANPYLNFPGNCAQAFKAYADVFGGTVEMEMTHGNSPMADQVGADWQDKIMHIQMKLPDGDLLMGSDAPPMYFEKPQGFAVSLQLSDPADAERIYAALSKGGEVRMELQKTFWAERFAMFSDRFGIPWIINCAAAA
jgi:PhnB protein